LLTGAVTAMAAVGAAGSAQAKGKTEKKVIRSGPKPPEPPLFSGTVQYGNLLFLSGVGYHKEGDITVHTEAVLADIKKQLEAAGSSMEKVLKCTVYLADGKDYKAMNDVFRGKFGDDPPVRTTVAAAWIPGNSLVEIDVIAYV
ncbi:MAG: 2-iminobutanoate/2-iminopropanoate deaminase, partial [Bryobacterales bacterium]|nr:2-iminobutanoate/2-iminopropanoate deaminase [Bryobacterales bacterium]